MRDRVTPDKLVDRVAADPEQPRGLDDVEDVVIDVVVIRGELGGRERRGLAHGQHTSSKTTSAMNRNVIFVTSNMDPSTM